LSFKNFVHATVYYLEGLSIVYLEGYLLSEQQEFSCMQLSVMVCTEQQQFCCKGTHFLLCICELLQVISK
jgi:hypothetical protein